MLVDLERAVHILYTSELIPANPMPLVGRPKLAKTLPKTLPTDSVTALLATLNSDPAAAPAQRLDGARPRPDPHRAAGRVASR